MKRKERINAKDFNSFETEGEKKKECVEICQRDPKVF